MSSEQNNGTLLDDVSWQILRELQEDARLSFAELGRRVGLSAPAVMERVRKLEDAGVIAAYRAEVNLKKIGMPVLAYIRISNSGGMQEGRIVEVAQSMPEVLECHHIIGNDCYILKVAASSIEHLEAIIGRYTIFNQTTTSIILSSPVERRTIQQTIAPSKDAN